MISLSDRRVLGALQLIDGATRAPLVRAVRVRANGARIYRNRSNLYVIQSAQGLEHHVAAYQSPPDVPPVGSVVVTLDITDPKNQYLPRTATVLLPRDANPDNFEQPNSLYQPVLVSLLPTPAIRTQANWSLVRSSLRRAGNAVVEGGLVLIFDETTREVLGRGVSDRRGEVLVIVPGIQIARFSSGPIANPPDDDLQPAPATPVVESATAAVAELSIHPSLSNEGGWPPDHEQLEADHVSNLIHVQPVSLRTGGTEQVTFQIP